MAENNDIQEGFLCPICHKDMRSPNNLITHFQDLHSEEQEFLKSIKEVYGKAKKKILKLDEQDIQNFKELTLNKYHIEYSEPQDPDRLLRTFGSDRKQQEQELVAWLDGSTVTRCPSCASSFNIARRQHHCRLCGCIMCNSCSYFLPYDVAQTIVAPVTNVSDREHSGKETDSLRTCVHCLNMLESRRKVQIEQMKKPTIWHLYLLLQSNKKQIQSSVDLYNKMYNSLTAGETTFLLQDVQALRLSIAEKAQMIETLGKKIASEPIDPEMPKAVLLQNNIWKATSNYIKDSLLTLPAPPTVQELEKIRERFSRMFQDDLPPQSAPAVKKVTVTTGWSPANISNDAIKGDQDDNPLIEQMNIVRNYITQARQAHRFEEVASLEENLRMLKETYRKQLKS
ncbi:hypothetical protein GWI33_021390 [Rhynchophorus ferrugineus]|uniref:Rabenosyn-5-like protein n=1 Tax=Rhynchophorus ferrugineus TaxID=354439 RepID=A0A834I1F9_RHYFE|nr:hypothetical protein GWI33_021390 [Rhynchophorus ferrugineus]